MSFRNIGDMKTFPDKQNLRASIAITSLARNSPHQSEWLKLTSQKKIDVGEDAEKREPSYTVGGNASCCSHSGKQYGGSSKS